MPSQPLPADPPMRDLICQGVASTLRCVSEVSFTLDGITIYASDFADVADQVQLGNIGVQYVPGQSKAYYNWKQNRFELGCPVPLMLEQEALIVHEGVHAAFDMRKLHIPVKQNEAVAYVAQSLYVLKRAGLDAGPLSSGRLGTAMEDKLLEIAWGIATSIDSGGEPLEEDVDNLKWIIGEIPDYQKSDTAYDGI